MTSSSREKLEATARRVTFKREYTRQRSPDRVGVPRLPPSAPLTSKREARARARPLRGPGGRGGEDGEQEERKTAGKTESHQERRDQGEGRRSVRPRARARADTRVCSPCSECTEQALLVRGHLSYDRSVPTLPAGAPASCLPPADLPPGSTDCPLLRPSTFTTAILPRTEPVGSLSFKLATHAPHPADGREWTP